MKNLNEIYSVCFLWQDFLILNKESLSQCEYILFENGMEFNSFEEAKEKFKHCIYSVISISDIQEVWPELLNQLETLQNDNTKYKVWKNSTIIGISSYK